MILGAAAARGDSDAAARRAPAVDAVRGLGLATVIESPSPLPYAAAMRLRSLALLPLVAACSSTPPPIEPAPAAPSSTAAVAGAPKATPDSVAPPASAPAAVAAEAPAEPPAAPEPLPLTAAEQKDTQRLCKPLMSAMARSKAKAGDQSPLEALQAALAKPPPSMKPADVERCRDLLGRGIHGYVAAAREVEARVILGQIALRAVGAYRETGKLCPDAAKVPADRALVARGPYESTAADWTSPGWTCLHFSFEGQPQRFQYEMRTDADGKGFELLAHGVPGENGRFVTIAQRGKVGEKGIEIGGVERR